MGQPGQPLAPQRHPYVHLVGVDQGAAVGFAAEDDGVQVAAAVVQHAEGTVVGVPALVIAVTRLSRPGGRNRPPGRCDSGPET